MHSKKTQRLRRAKKTRARIARSGAFRLCVHKTSRHMYAQIIKPQGVATVVSASSLDPELRGKIKHGGNIEAAIEVGKVLTKRTKEAGIKKVVFDRSGFQYHGRIKALAETVRKEGIEL